MSGTEMSDVSEPCPAELSTTRITIDSSSRMATPTMMPFWTCSSLRCLDQSIDGRRDRMAVLSGHRRLRGGGCEVGGGVGTTTLAAVGVDGDDVSGGVTMAVVDDIVKEDMLSVDGRRPQAQGLGGGGLRCWCRVYLDAIFQSLGLMYIEQSKSGDGLRSVSKIEFRCLQVSSLDDQPRG